MTDIPHNIRIPRVCRADFPIASFWVNSTGCSGEFHVLFGHFEDLKSLILNIWKRNWLSLASGALYPLKLYNF